MRTRLHPTTRREQILDAAVTAAARSHYMTLKRAEVATEAGCAEGLVTHYFGSMADLREAIIDHAISQGVTAVMRQAIDRVPAELRGGLL